MRSLAMFGMLAWGVAEAAPCHVVRDTQAFVEGALVAPADVVWADGQIRYAGPSGTPDAARASEGCTPHEAAYVTPTFVVLGQPLGMVEIGLESSTRDDSVGRERAISPSLVAADGFDPASEAIGPARRGGILDALVTPSGGLVSGTASALRLDGTSAHDPSQQRLAGLVVHPKHPGSIAAGVARIRTLVQEARAWHQAGRPWPWPGSTHPLPELAATLDALGDRPTPCAPTSPIQLWAHADRAADIATLARLAEEIGACLGVLGGAEAWKVAEDLVRTHALVVLDPMVYGPGTMDQRHARRDQAARLVAAGAQVSFVVPDLHRAGTLRLQAGNAVREGMAWDDAMTAITATPRARLGLAGGHLRAGEPADLALWSADPLDTPARLLGLFRGGEPVSWQGRQEALTERYRSLPPPRLPPQAPSAP